MMPESFGRLTASRNVVGTLAVFVVASGILLGVGRKDYPELHAILDTGMFLLSAVLALLLSDMAGRTGQRLPRWMAISFATTSVLHFVHVMVSVEWSGPLAPIAHAAHVLRPTTWPPAAHILPMGITEAHSNTPHTVDIVFHEDVDTSSDALKAAVAAAARVAPDTLPIGRRKVRLTVQEKYLDDLAALDAVRVIQEVPTVKLRNNIARIIGVIPGGHIVWECQGRCRCSTVRR